MSVNNNNNNNNNCSNNKAHQHFVGWSCESGQYIHALGREIPLGLGALTLAVRPASPHHVVSILTLQEDEVTSMETEECRTLACRGREGGEGREGREGGEGERGGRRREGREGGGGGG